MHFESKSNRRQTKPCSGMTFLFGPQLGLNLGPDHALELAACQKTGAGLERKATCPCRRQDFEEVAARTRNEVSSACRALAELDPDWVEAPVGRTAETASSRLAVPATTGKTALKRYTFAEIEVAERWSRVLLQFVVQIRFIQPTVLLCSCFSTPSGKKCDNLAKAIPNRVGILKSRKDYEKWHY